MINATINSGNAGPISSVPNPTMGEHANRISSLISSLILVTHPPKFSRRQSRALKALLDGWVNWLVDLEVNRHTSLADSPAHHAAIALAGAFHNLLTLAELDVAGIGARAGWNLGHVGVLPH